MGDRSNWNSPEPKDASERFARARAHLDAARDDLASAQTRFIEAEREYSAASTAFTSEYFRERTAK